MTTAYLLLSQALLGSGLPAAVAMFPLTGKLQLVILVELAVAHCYKTVQYIIAKQKCCVRQNAVAD